MDMEPETDRQISFTEHWESREAEFPQILGKHFPGKTLLDEHMSFISIPTDDLLGTLGASNAFSP